MRRRNDEGDRKVRTGGKAMGPRTMASVAWWYLILLMPFSSHHCPPRLLGRRWLLLLLLPSSLSDHSSSSSCCMPLELRRRTRFRLPRVLVRMLTSSSSDSAFGFAPADSSRDNSRGRRARNASTASFSARSTRTTAMGRPIGGALLACRYRYTQGQMDGPQRTGRRKEKGWRKML